jgi:hypothetical protein
MNEGIINKGNISASQVVAGRNSKAIINGNLKISDPDLAQIDKRINRIASELLEKNDSLDNKAEILEMLYSLRSDLKANNPNKDSIEEKFKKLTHSVSSVTSLFTSINALKAAVLAMI